MESQNGLTGVFVLHVIYSYTNFPKSRTQRKNFPNKNRPVVTMVTALVSASSDTIRV